jgi:hypothetical protein
LLNTAEVSTSDVSGLHEKLDRMKSVEQQNKETVKLFEENFNENVSHIEEDAQSYKTQQQDSHQTCLANIGKFISYKRYPKTFCYEISVFSISYTLAFRRGH